MGCCRNNNDVGGASNNRRKRRNDVAGVRNFNGSSCNNNDVAGVSDDNFRVPVKSFIEGEDFCRAVNRCLRNDLAGAEDDRRRRNKGRHWDSWF
ncbi:hypothetical protein GCM10010954_12180 [Halobacillus andaensis]|uniref:Uncharacterized protein n=1 Tax=Halobacillus andaensis TaxID=1176239 RepID=A0A917B0R8_HALAA|nr:hypothetical protein [Halobacillus andaensis]MBP2004015.1 hypothetical protein [Halobacillus andaensis]GGF15136.1 hypothetical protein GCM10010954_12180 [Halobacillus andaensis]